MFKGYNLELGHEMSTDKQLDEWMTSHNTVLPLTCQWQGAHLIHDFCQWGRGGQTDGDTSVPTGGGRMLAIQPILRRGYKKDSEAYFIPNICSKQNYFDDAENKQILNFTNNIFILSVKAQK